MLTKKDLDAIQAMFKDSKVKIIDEVGDMIQNHTNVLVGLIQKNSNELLTLMQKNTDDLIELINTGIHLQEKHNNKIDCLVDNHEYRIGTLEKKTFTAN